MKKSVLFFMMVAVVSVLSFADTVWHFKSGSHDIGSEKFHTVIVKNQTGTSLVVENEYLQDNAEVLFFTDSVIISSDAINSGNFEAYYAINRNQLEVVVGVRNHVLRPSFALLAPTIVVVPHHLHVHPVKPAPRPPKARPEPQRPPKAKPEPPKKEKPKPGPKPKPTPRPAPSKRPPKPIK